MSHGNPLLPPYEVRQGNCLPLLRDIPKHSIHCVVTSPPYWGGVRNYGTESQIWGGLSDCHHRFEEIFTPNPNAGGGKTQKQLTNEGSFSSDDGARGRTSAICRICSAWKGELGSEPELWRYLANLGEICDAIWDALRPDGTFWLNLGDVYASGGNGPGPEGSKQRTNPGANVPRRKPPEGLKNKDLCLVPHRVAIMLQERGWWVRSDIVWAKGRSGETDEDGPGTAMPYPVTDRPNKTHEYIFLLTKSEDYFYDHYAVREGSATTNRADKDRGDFAGKWEGHEGQESFRHVSSQRELRSVWNLSPKGFRGKHFAIFPLEIPTLAILAGTSAYGVCVECGAPWEPVVEKGEADLERQRACGGDANGEYSSDGVKDYEGTGAQNGSTVKANTLKSQRKIAGMTWQPTCLCGCTEVKPATVLDPFCGSGSTLIAARRNGRIGIGLELLPENVEMSRQRIEVESLGRPMKFTKPRKGQPALFDTDEEA